MKISLESVERLRGDAKRHEAREAFGYVFFASTSYVDPRRQIGLEVEIDDPPDLPPVRVELMNHWTRMTYRTKYG